MLDVWELGLLGLLFLVVIGIPLTALVLSVAALGRLRRVKGVEERFERLEKACAHLLQFRPEEILHRMDRLERRIAEVSPEATAEGPPRAVEAIRPPGPAEPEIPKPVLLGPPIAPVAEPAPPASSEPLLAEPIPPAESAAVRWELFLGRKALGWTSVLVFIFAIAFFLRHAFQNQWLGPLGQVMIGALVGVGLIGAGWHYYRSAWYRFSQMWTAAGAIVLYLSVYASFGFYELVPQTAAIAFLVILVVLSGLLAVVYRGWPLAAMAVIGGLLTPLLMRSVHDRYMELFLYLLALNVGVVLMMIGRGWSGLGLLGLAGTQIVYWMWYAAHYHPEKFAWALGFQAGLYLFYTGYEIGWPCSRQPAHGWPAVLRQVLAAFGWSWAAYVLLREDYADYLGSAALAMAIFYTLVAWWGIRQADYPFRQVLTLLGIASGFIAAAFPLQAHREVPTRWVEVAWAAEAAVLGWFGSRTRAGLLRALAAALAVAALIRLGVHLPPVIRSAPFRPVFNPQFLSSLVTLGCLLGWVAAARSFLPLWKTAEQWAMHLFGLLLLVGLWGLLSLECVSFFQTQSRWFPAAGLDWARMRETTLSILWPLYASALLALGIRFRLAGLRWLAMALYGLTVLKVFLIDIAQLERFYRILAFLALAVVLAVAAWVYQRLRWEENPLQSKTELIHPK